MTLVVGQYEIARTEVQIVKVSLEDRAKMIAEFKAMRAMKEAKLVSDLAAINAQTVAEMKASVA